MGIADMAAVMETDGVKNEYGYFAMKKEIPFSA